MCGQVGQTILHLKHDNPDELRELECSCEGSIACSTCHVIVDDAHYPYTGEISDMENDMLDLASGLTRTSRPGCQVKLSKELDGVVFTIPYIHRT